MTFVGSKTGKTYTLAAEIDFGGQAHVYRVHEDPNLVAKIFHGPTADLSDRVDAMVAMTPVSLTNLSAPMAVAWPVELLSAGTGVVGYVMPFVQGRLNLGLLLNPSARPAWFDDRVLVTAMMRVAGIVAQLHIAGFGIGDLNEKNFLVSDRADVALIDADSLSFVHGGRRFSSPVARPEFTPPELMGVAPASRVVESHHDDFSLAVLMFMAFMDGCHPFGGVPKKSAAAFLPIVDRIRCGYWVGTRRKSPLRPQHQMPSLSRLDPEIRRLFGECFEDGHRRPQARPPATAWVAALRQLLAGTGQRLAPAASPPPAPVPVRNGRTWAVVNARLRPHLRKVMIVVIVLIVLLALAGWRRGSEPSVVPDGLPTPDLWKQLSGRSTGPR